MASRYCGPLSYPRFGGLSSARSAGRQMRDERARFPRERSPMQRASSEPARPGPHVRWARIERLANPGPYCPFHERLSGLRVPADRFNFNQAPRLPRAGAQAGVVAALSLSLRGGRVRRPLTSAGFCAGRTLRGNSI